MTEGYQKAKPIEIENDENMPAFPCAAHAQQIYSAVKRRQKTYYAETWKEWKG